MLEYEHIKHNVSQIPCDNPTLHLLVTAFKKEICSQRRCDSIKNVSDLIRILERRDVLNVHNQEPFEDIRRLTGHNHTINFENLHAPVPLEHNSNTPVPLEQNSNTPVLLEHNSNNADQGLYKYIKILE